MTEWMTLVGVFIAAGATMAVQLLINRGEPSAIKRIKLLNEAIDGIREDDEARQALVGARSKLVAKLAKSLVGLEGVARWLRASAWTVLAVGTGILILCVVVMTASGPSSEWWSVGVQWFQIGFLLVTLAPILLVYSAIWPGFAADARDFRRRLADRNATRGYRKIREALTVDVPDNQRSGGPAAAAN